MITLGVDPGRTIDDSCFIAVQSPAKPPWSGISRVSPAFYTTALELNAAVIEWPHTIPGMGGPDIDATIRTAALIAARLQEAGVPVYIPRRDTILGDLGRRPFTRGNKDKWLRDYLTRIHINVSRSSMLSTTHARAAYAAALFNWRDPRNQQYRAVAQ